jgi:hypothetical protein
MPKYYVKSGQLKFIIDAENHREAIISTLKYYKGKGLMSGGLICVSEIGFNDKTKQQKCYKTDDYIGLE